MIDGDARLSRRAVLAGIAGALGTVGCDDGGAQARGSGAARSPAGSVPAAPERRVRPLSDFGVDRLATRDQWTVLKRAFEAAAAEGFDLVADPDANYRHDGALMLDGVSLDGHGCTFTALSDGPRVLRCVGTGWRVANLRLLGAARVRTSSSDRNGIMIGDDNSPASDFVLENVTVDAVGPGRGVSGAGFMFNRASRGRIVRPTVRHSLADGIHITNGSHELVFERSLSENTGDDGFAVVSYVPQGRICHHIRLTGGISRDSLGRGFSVVGGRDIVMERPNAERSAAAGVYLYGEGGWNTYGVARCQVADALVVGCSTGRGQAPGFSNAAIIIGGREGADSVDGERLARGAADCVVANPVVRGAGPACTAAISTHEYALQPRILGAQLHDIVSTNPFLPASGIEIGGRDVVVERPQMTNIAGLAIAVTRTASGNCLVSDPRVAGSRLKGTGADSFIYVDQAKALQRIEIRNGTFTRGPRRLGIEALPDRLRLVGNKVG